MSRELSPLEAFNKITSGGCKGKYHKYCEIVETALMDYERAKEWDFDTKKSMKEVLDIFYSKPLKALAIIKENVGLKMSVDDNVACLYVPIVKTFEPLEKNIVVVGFVQGQDKIDLLKEVLL